jgi:creatinine amidohydrolase
MHAVLDLAHTDARRLLTSGAPVYLSVNPVEYHGPHLSLHNDRVLSIGCIAALGERLQQRHDWPILTADHLELGVEPCPGPGSRPFSFATVRDAVVESCRALAELGATRVVLMTFHGSPLHNLALQAGVDELRRRGLHAVAPFHAVLREMLDYSGPEPYADALAFIADAATRDRIGRELATDFHAGFFETSLALAWAPDTVSPIHRDLRPCPEITPDRALAAASAMAKRLGRDSLARELDFAARATGWTSLRPFPGYTGSPHLANTGSGRVFATHVVDRYETLVDDVLHARAEPPPPIVSWAAWATGGGRLLPIERLGHADVVGPP